MSELRELYQQLIIDHGRNPRNFGELPAATHSQEGYNPLCGDRLMLFLRMEAGKIAEAKFTGNGCAISLASASLMLEAIRGKTLQQVELLFSAFHALVTGASSADESLGKLMVLGGVSEYPARVKCATLCWHTLLSALPAVEFTAAAAQHIKNKIKQRVGGKGFRLSVKASGCNGYRYQPEIIDEIKETDIALSLAEDLVVYIDPASMDFLKGTVVDFVKKGLGQSILIFQNPNATSECGCGESFAVQEKV